jgi:hypothetical protein
MKRKFIYTLLLLLSAGCNEFIDVSGRFLNRINDTSKINLNINISVLNDKSVNLPNILVSIVDDHDSLLIIPPRLTDNNCLLSVSLPDEQIREISPYAINLLIVAEHPELGISYKSISINELYSRNSIVCEFTFNTDLMDLSKQKIENYQFHTKTIRKSQFPFN